MCRQKTQIGADRQGVHIRKLLNSTLHSSFSAPWSFSAGPGQADLVLLPTQASFLALSSTHLGEAGQLGVCGNST